MTRVAAYCRVSTDKKDQINSFESQKTYFRDYIQKHADWTLSEIYADEGVTGTSTKNRVGFLRMIEDAHKGAIDLIITKEVSRFSRNILDAISYTRALKSNGVGVIFLNDGISTLEADAELRLSIMASFAQEESRKTSERVKWGQQRKMESGVVFGRSLLGYEVVGGKISIEPQGAAIVRQIYSMYLQKRMGTRAIATALTENGLLTKSGNETWSAASVLKTIKNEKYCGDLIQRKTVTPDYLTHKKSINNKTEDLIYIENHHAPIISREEWNAAQTERRRRNPGTNKQKAHGNRYELSGKMLCDGCGSVYLCRTRKRKDGSVYRVWTKGACTCQGKNGQIREDHIAELIRYIIAMYDRDALIGGLSNIISQTTVTRDKSTGDQKNRILFLEKKKRRLLDIFLSGGVNSEDYIAANKRLDSEIVRLKEQLLENDSADVRWSLAELDDMLISMAAGRDGDDSFYLNLVDKIKVVSNGHICIFFTGLSGNWSVSFR